MKDPADHYTPELPLGFTEAATADAEAGMAWWNAMTETQRLEACEAAESYVPAVAWARYKNRDALQQLDQAMVVLGRVRSAWKKHFG